VEVTAMVEADLRGTEDHGRDRFSLYSAIAALLVALVAIGSPKARAADPIKIGFSMPLTGGFASAGKAILTAYQMWEEHINAQGGLAGRSVQLVYYDDQSDPSVVRAICAKLFDIDKIDLVLSSYGTNLTALPVVIPHKRVLTGLFALAINEQFNYPYYFSMFPGGPDAVHEFSRGFFEIAKVQKLATFVIVGNDSDFAKKATDGAHDNALKMGFKIVYERSYPPQTVDYSPVLRAIRTTNPDFIYVVSHPTDTVSIIRAAHEIGLKTGLLGGGMVGAQYAAIKMQLGEQLNGIANYDFYVPEPTVSFAGIEDFLKRHKAKTGGMDALCFFVPSFAYANLQVLGQAVIATGTVTEQQKLREYLRTNSFKTIVGDIRYAPNGEWAIPRVLQIQFQKRGNDLDQFKRAGNQVILYPTEFASRILQAPYAAAL
jgi:branched-chain amino acid transport system substrate-binding protein